MAAGFTYTPIATTTLGSAASSVTFSSISGAYTDLVVVCNAGTTASGGWVLSMQLNGDTGNNYSGTRLSGNGTTAASYRQANLNYYFAGLGMPNTLTTNVIFHLMNYSNTTTYKTALIRMNDAGVGTAAMACLWRNTAAITSINLSAEVGGTTLLAGSTFTLYGIAAA
jgi:hypothetical protein